MGDFRIEKLSEGESTELPRWVAEGVVQLNLAEMGEEPFERRVLQGNEQGEDEGPFQISNLSPDFYLRMGRRLAYLQSAASAGKVRKAEYQRLRASSYDMIGI